MPVVMVAPVRVVHQVRRRCAAKLGKRHRCDRLGWNLAREDRCSHCGRYNGPTLALLACGPTDHIEAPLIAVHHSRFAPDGGRSP